MKREFSRQLVEKYWNIKFHEICPSGQIYRQNETNGRSPKFLRTRLIMQFLVSPCQFAKTALTLLTVYLLNLKLGWFILSVCTQCSLVCT